MRLLITIVLCSIFFNVDAKIPRSAAAKAEFQRQQPCPSTGRIKGKCHGYVIDHIKPLACKGDDAPSNMQWQTVAEAKEKDKWERKACKAH